MFSGDNWCARICCWRPHSPPHNDHSYPIGDLDQLRRCYSDSIPTAYEALDEGSRDVVLLLVDLHLVRRVFFVDLGRSTGWNCLCVREWWWSRWEQDRQRRAVEPWRLDSSAPDAAVRDPGRRRQPTKRQAGHRSYHGSRPIRPRAHNRPDTCRCSRNRSFGTYPCQTHRRRGLGSGLTIWSSRAPRRGRSASDADALDAVIAVFAAIALADQAVVDFNTSYADGYISVAE